MQQVISRALFAPVSHPVPMDDVEPKAVARRLRALMAHMDLQRVQDLADTLGLERSAVSNWLNGYHLPPVPHMQKLVLAVQGLTLDWVYSGNANALPVALAIRLGALEQMGFVPEVAPEPDPGPVKGAARRRKARQAT